MICSFTTLDEKALETVQRVETETGQTVLAYNFFEPEELRERDLEKIKAAEKELCLTLMAVKAGH